MEKEIKELMFGIINDIKPKMDYDPIYFLLYKDFIKLLEEYYDKVLINQTATHLRMKHLLNNIREISSELSSKNELNVRIKSLVAKLVKFHKIIFDFHNMVRLETIYYRNEVTSYLKREYKMKKYLKHSLCKAKYMTTLSMKLANKVESDWKQIYDQLCEKSLLINKVINIYERDKYVDVENVIVPIADSFIVLRIATQSLINSIELLKNTKGLGKEDKSELNFAINKLKTFKLTIDKAKEYHDFILSEIRSYKDINMKYNNDRL